MRSTDIGYINNWKQKNMGITEKHAVRPYARIYQMYCTVCCHTYFANGSDIHLKKCPNCQGGKDTAVM